MSKAYMLGAAVALGSVLSFVPHVDAAAIASFTFETIPPTLAVGVLADQGVGTAALNTGGTISNPAGNAVGATPSIESYSSNGWDVGDYYEFAVPTTGFEDITVDFDITGSNTGPRDFNFTYSTDGTNFTTFGAVAAVTNDGWNTSADQAASARFFDLSALPVVDNAALFTVRIIDSSTTSVSGATVAAGGTSRIDNVNFSGTATAITPEPTTLAAIAGASILGLRRRRA